MERAQVKLGVITEVHIVPLGSPPGIWHNPFLFDQAEQLFRNALARCVEQRVDAIAILGDLTHYADSGSFARIRQALETVDLPVYVLPGNHDLDTSARPLEAFQQALALRNVSIPPRRVSLTPEIELALVGLEPGEDGNGYAAVRAEASSLHPKLTVVLTHFPPFAMQEMLADAGLKHAGDLTNRVALLEAIASIPGPVLIVNGHLHVHATMVDGCMLQLSVAALIEPPHDFTILTIGVDDAGKPWVTRQACGVVKSGDVSLPVLSARDECWQFEDGTWQHADAHLPD